MIAGENKDGFATIVFDMRVGLANGVGCTLEPVGAFRSYFGGDDLNKTICERAEPIGASNVAIKRGGVVLRENEDSQEVGVDAVRDRNIDQAIVATERDGGLGAQASEREQALANSAAKDNR